MINISKAKKELLNSDHTQLQEVLTVIYTTDWNLINIKGFNKFKYNSYLWLWPSLFGHEILIELHTSGGELIIKLVAARETWNKTILLVFIEIFYSPGLETIFWALQSNYCLRLLCIFNLKDSWCEVLLWAYVELMVSIQCVLECLLSIVELLTLRLHFYIYYIRWKETINLLKKKMNLSQLIF